MIRKFIAIFFVLVMLFQTLPIKSYYAKVDFSSICLSEENTETSTKLPAFQEIEEEVIHYWHINNYSPKPILVIQDKQDLILDEHLYSSAYSERQIKPPLYS